MKKTILANDFVSAFKLSQYHNSFSHAALVAIFTHICAGEESTGVQTELCISDIAARWTEYDCTQSYLDEYSLSFGDVGLDQGEAWAEMMENDELNMYQKEIFFNRLREQTTVLDLENGGFLAIDA